MNETEYNRRVDYLNKLCVEYYDNNMPSVSDAVYDSLYNEVKLYEETHAPRKDSPTQRVGSGNPTS